MTRPELMAINGHQFVSVTLVKLEAEMGAKEK